MIAPNDDDCQPDLSERGADADPLAALVAAVADRARVDWTAIAADVGEDDRDVLDDLRLLAELGAASDTAALVSRLSDPAWTAASLESPSPGTPAAGRFELEECLGRGGFGVVYKAFDRERQIHVALKAFTTPGIDSVYRFKKEFRVLADLTHPNLVGLYELFADERSWFIVMELVVGVDFLSYVRGVDGTAPALDAPGPARCEWSRLGRAMTQLCSALAHLHGEGKLHCDIKPSNILVTADGQVKLLDFGLATDISPSMTDAASGVRGTPAYVAPEQVAGAAPTAASDWYAVGVVLFEAITGARPFRGTVTEVLAAKQHAAAAAAATLADVPPALNALCAWLLERDPAERPSDSEVLGSIAGIWPELSLPVQGVAVPRAVHAFVGREMELAQFDQAFSHVTDGRAHAMFVDGASGMGKSALIRRGLDTIRQRRPDAVVLEGRCSERESVPYKALDSLVDRLVQYLAALPVDDLVTLLPRDGAALVRLFPVLRRLEHAGTLAPPPVATDAQELRRRGAKAFRELLASLAQRYPLVLAIDDLHWTDADSAVILRELLFDADAPPLLFVGTYRTDEAAGNHALRQLLAAAGEARSPGDSGTTAVSVGVLSAAEARELTVVLTQAHDASIAVDAVVEESGRSPLFIHQLVQYSAVAAAGGIVTAPQWPVAGPGERRFTLDSVIRARTATLGHGPRRLLDVLAVVGAPIGLQLAGTVAESGATVLSDCLTLRAARLARSRIDGIEERLEVYHDRIREAIVSDVPAAELRSLHGRIAVALEATGAADPEALVHHFHGGGHHAAAARYAVAAGDRAADALAFDRAVQSYRFALQFGQFDDGGRRVRTKLGDALGASGRGYEAARTYLDAAATSSGDAVVELKRRASEQLLQSGHLDEGMTVVADVLRRVGLRLPDTPRRALASLLLLRARIALRGLGVTPRDERHIPHERLATLDTCWSVTTGLAIVDHIRSAEFGARYLLLALEAGEPMRVIRALAMELAYTSISGARSRPRNQTLIAAAQALATQVVNPEAGALIVLGRGSAAYMEGQWPLSLDLCEEATRILRERCAGVAWHTDTAQFYTLLSLLYLGEIAELARRLPVLLKEARDRDALYAETILRTRLAYVAHLAADDVPAAVLAIREGMERWSQQGFHNQHYYEMVATAETQLYEGQGTAAWTGLTSRWSSLARTLLLRVQPIEIESVHLRARTAVAAAMAAGVATPQKETLLRAAERDAARIRRTRAPWAAGLADLVLGGTAALRGVRERAVTQFASAEATFTSAQMRLHAAAAQQRRGTLIDGAAGRQLVATAHDTMRAQGIRRPDAFARMLAPGL